MDRTCSNNWATVKCKTKNQVMSHQALSTMESLLQEFTRARLLPRELKGLAPMKLQNSCKTKRIESYSDLTRTIPTEVLFYSRKHAEKKTKLRCESWINRQL